MSNKLNVVVSARAADEFDVIWTDQVENDSRVVRPSPQFHLTFDVDTSPSFYVISVSDVKLRREWIAVLQTDHSRPIGQFVLNTTDLGISGIPVVAIEYGREQVRRRSLFPARPTAAAPAAVADDGLRCYIISHEGRSLPPPAPTQQRSPQSLRQQLNGLDRAFAGLGLVRLDDLQVDVRLDDAKSRLTAIVHWRRTGPVPAQVGEWQITVRNLTWLQNDFTYNHRIYRLDRHRSHVELPIWLRSGNRYEVVVRGLSPADDAEFSEVRYKASCEFRAGEILSLADMEQLLQRAINYRAPSSRHLRTDDAKCFWFHRNKPHYFFDRIDGGDGVMRAYLKDSSGDLRCPINGEINGLFFLATPRNAKGQPQKRSPFGDKRLSVRADSLIGCSNVYFADFACLHHHPRKLHHVTLVLARPGSEADAFCREHLPALDVNDTSGRNPFLFRRRTDGELRVSRQAFVDVFVADDLDVKSMVRRGVAQVLAGRSIVGPGTTTQGGLLKTIRCPDCDIFSGLPVATKPVGVDEF